MKLTLSALFALHALMPAITAQDLDPHVILTFASNWNSGTLSVNDKFIQISDQTNKIPIDVNGNTSDYRYLAEVEFDKVDKDAWVYFNITQSGAQAGSNHVSSIWKTHTDVPLLTRDSAKRQSGETQGCNGFTSSSMVALM